MATVVPGPLERDTIRDLVLPALRDAGWSDDQIVREYYLRAKKTVSFGGVSRDIDDGYADLVLKATPGAPVAVVEAKRSYRTAEQAIQQAIRYAQQLDAPLAYGTNGTEIIERNLRTGGERRVSQYAAPAMAWSEYQTARRIDAETAALLAQPFNRNRLAPSGDVIQPRAYQVVAINRVLAAIGRGEKRVLLLMATGTGKTFSAMQVVAKLRAYEAQARPDRNYRVLYLADRDFLLQQPMGKDFAPAFGNDPLSRVLGQTDLSREIYFASYQALSGSGDSEAARLMGFRPDFFDLVIVDECHRGSADENSAWRAVLDRFTSAVQLGLTATPRDDTVQSYEYFGNPVFAYSLREGIEDGYLAPYRVRRVVLSPDADGWEPGPGELDRFGREVPDGVYTTRDFERVVSLLARTRLAAAHLSALLRDHPRPRVIVFCVDTEHAADMRAALIIANPDRVRDDPEWVVRIVGIEGERARLLEDFCDPTRYSPAIATTSRMLSTGVDVEDLTHVVLLRPVGSMIEFKQIIGRGTRLYPETGKTSFEIVDYVGASDKFNDPGFDGYPAAITVERIDGDGEVVDSIVLDPVSGAGSDGSESLQVNEPEVPFTVEPGPSQHDVAVVRRKYYMDAGDFTVASETRLVPSTASGRLELTEYGALVRDRIRAIGDVEDLRRNWATAESRSRLRAALQVAGIDVSELVEAAGEPHADPLDALYHVAWNLPLRTRAQRARQVREAHEAELRRLSARARAVLEGLLQRYEEYGITDLETTDVFRLEPLSRIGSVSELALAAGGAEQLRAQLDRVQKWLYSA